MVEVPQWGRENRRVRRETARALAKEYMHSAAAHTSRVHVALWFLETFMALGLLLAAPKIGRDATAVVLVAMAACLFHPIWHFRVVQQASSTSRRASRFAGLMLMAVALVALFGAYVWPPIKRHTLAADERASFKSALSMQKGDDLDVQITCPIGDEKTCTYAEQFINLVGASGWKIEPYVLRLTLSRARDGITIYRRGGNKDYISKHWDAGGYFAINEPHLLAMQKAFQSIHSEPDGGTNPDLAEHVMAIYFGPEKDNEAEPTSLTRSTEWVTGKRTGPFPTPQQ
jgi:hypothetical protein